MNKLLATVSAVFVLGAVNTVKAEETMASTNMAPMERERPEQTQAWRDALKAKLDAARDKTAQEKAAFKEKITNMSHGRLFDVVTNLRNKMGSKPSEAPEETVASAAPEAVADAVAATH